MTRKRKRKYDPDWTTELLLLADIAVVIWFGFAFVRALEMAAW